MGNSWHCPAARFGSLRRPCSPDPACISFNAQKQAGLGFLRIDLDEHLVARLERPDRLAEGQKIEVKLR